MICSSIHDSALYYLRFPYESVSKVIAVLVYFNVRTYWFNLVFVKNCIALIFHNEKYE